VRRGRLLYREWLNFAPLTVGYSADPSGGRVFSHMVDGSRRVVGNIFDRRRPPFIRFGDASLGNVESDGRVFGRDGMQSKPGRPGRVESSTVHRTGGLSTDVG
jgi:hypothetical protein